MNYSIKFLLLVFASITIFNSCKEDEIFPIEYGTGIDAPTQISPANNAVVQAYSITFTWNKMDRATGYSLQISTDSNFSSFAYRHNELTDTSWDVDILENNFTYFWRVNAHLQAVTNSDVTSWSTVWRITKAIIMNIPCPGTPTVQYGGKTYNTVQIGSQCWLKENLDVGTMIQGNDSAKDNGTIEKHCYDDNPNNCDIYGGLYQWNEAMQYLRTEGTQGICPQGWHVPNHTEYQTLITTVGGKSNTLMAVGQGNGFGAGTNISGFSALFSGYRLYDGSFHALGIITNLWKSSEADALTAYTMYMYSTGSFINVFNRSNKRCGCSVRCIKD